MSTSIHLLTRITPRNFDHVSTFCAKTSQTFCGLIYTPLKIYLHSSYKNLQANIVKVLRLQICILPSTLDVSRKKIELKDQYHSLHSALTIVESDKKTFQRTLQKDICHNYTSTECSNFSSLIP